MYRHNSSVIKLNSPFYHHSTAQSALKGNVITFMQNIPDIVASLPLNVDELCDTLKIIVVGAHIPNREHLQKVCGVSREKVRNEGGNSTIRQSRSAVGCRIVAECNGMQWIVRDCNGLQRIASHQGFFSSYASEIRMVFMRY